MIAAVVNVQVQLFGNRVAEIIIGKIQNQTKGLVAPPVMYINPVKMSVSMLSCKNSSGLDATLPTRSHKRVSRFIAPVRATKAAIGTTGRRVFCHQLQEATAKMVLIISTLRNQNSRCRFGSRLIGIVRLKKSQLLNCSGFLVKQISLSLRQIDACDTVSHSEMSE